MAEQIYFIDEVVKDDKSNYNPMLDPSIATENFVEIKERQLPGKKARFNNVADASTKEAIVTGLVLDFSQDLADSRLKSLLGRTDLEFLYLYADTIVINHKLVFPQTNVTVCCRHLIIEENGTLSTLPEEIAQPYAVGTGADPRKPGATGETAGNLTLLCNTIENKRGNTDAVFLLNGAKGQNGEMGGLNAINTDSKYPLSWNDIKTKIIENDWIKGNSDNWVWPDTSDTDKVYYADIHASNLSWDSKDSRRWYKTSLGDSGKANQNNGPDAIASGPGGNGGNGGTLNYLEFNKVGKDTGWNLTGGTRGLSTRIEGGKKTLETSYYHIRIKAWHKDANYWLNKIGRKDMEPEFSKTNTISPRDGYAAKNADGNDGATGKAEKLPADKNSWMHPILLETMLQFAKTAFRDGDRKRAGWILNIYNNALKTLPAGLKQEMRTASASREIALYVDRLEKNLDFYGYPPGWIPRLSVLSNLEVIKDSRRDLARTLFFANRLLKASDENKFKADDLDLTVKELKKGLKNAQADISASFAELPGIQNKINILEGQVREQLRLLRDLKVKIIAEAKNIADAQKLFTGSFQILAGVCSLVPVGQPYLGKLGGGILSKIGEINIDSGNPMGEALSFTNGLSEKVGDFCKDNEGKFKSDITSGLKNEIDKGTKELNEFNDKIALTAGELKAAKTALEQTFKDQEISLIRDKMAAIRTINSGGAGLFSTAEDYADIIVYMDEVQQGINNAKDITTARKQELTTKLATFKNDKKDLGDKLKANKKKKESREKGVETAGKVIKGFTEGITSIAGGIQTMMVEFDENDPEVQKKMENIKNSKYSKEFETINKKVAEINKQKLPLTESLLRLEQKISDGVQRINTNLVQWSVLNEQRVMEVQYGLMPATILYLKGMVQQSWDLLMQECYYLTKSYQYRFIEKIDPLQHGIKELITDIEKFSNGKDPGTMTETQYTELFDMALKSQFKRLAFDLLVKMQGNSARINDEESSPVIDYNDAVGRKILDQLNTFGSATFRLENLKSAKHGTSTWFNYRIIKISFLRIAVETEADNANVSFDFGIRHSGDSLIRSSADERLYFFTSRSSKKNSKPTLRGTDNPGDKHNDIDLQVQSWNGSYNGSNRNTAAGPLSNSKDSGLDQRLLYKFLADFDLKEDYDAKKQPYKDHYPGATSELMLMVYTDPDKLDFKIKELQFKVEYEVLR